MAPSTSISARANEIKQSARGIIKKLDGFFIGMLDVIFGMEKVSQVCCRPDIVVEAIFPFLSTSPELSSPKIKLFLFLKMFFPIQNYHKTLPKNNRHPNH